MHTSDGYGRHIATGPFGLTRQALLSTALRLSSSPRLESTIYAYFTRTVTLRLAALHRHIFRAPDLLNLYILRTLQFTATQQWPTSSFRVRKQRPFRLLTACPPVCRLATTTHCKIQYQLSHSSGPPALPLFTIVARDLIAIYALPTSRQRRRRCRRRRHHQFIFNTVITAHCIRLSIHLLHTYTSTLFTIHLFPAEILFESM